MELIRRLSNYGKDNNLSEGISFKIKMPKVNNEKHEALPPNLIASLLNTLDQSTDILEVAFIRMCLFTGRRVGEIGNLTWKDIDLETKRMCLKDTKTNRDEYLPICDHLIEMLSTMPRFSPVWVFPNTLGKQRQRLDKTARNIIRSAGVSEQYRAGYCLRHTFASTAGDLEVNWTFIKELLGHSNGSRDITDRYVKISFPSLLGAANQVANHLLSYQQRNLKIVDFPNGEV